MNEALEKMKNNEGEIADFEEALSTLDLDIDEITEVKQYLKKLGSERENLRAAVDALRFQKRRMIHFVLARQHSLPEIPEIAEWP